MIASPVAIQSQVRKGKARFPFADIDLGKLQSQLSDKNSIVFSGGKASVELDGNATSETVDLAMMVTVQDMQAGSKGKGLFGLDPKVTREAVNVLKNMRTTIRLVGPIAEPRVVLDSQALREEFKNLYTQHLSLSNLLEKCGLDPSLESEIRPKRDAGLRDGREI